MSVALIYMDEARELLKRASEHFNTCHDKNAKRCPISLDHFTLFDDKEIMKNEDIHDMLMSLKDELPKDCGVCHPLMYLRLSDIFLRSAHASMNKA